MENYYAKYIKYKNKYLKLKKNNYVFNNDKEQKGGTPHNSGTAASTIQYVSVPDSDSNLAKLPDELPPCPSIPIIGAKSVAHYLRNYNCLFWNMVKKGLLKYEGKSSFNKEELEKTNLAHPKNIITMHKLFKHDFPLYFLLNNGFTLKDLFEGKYLARHIKEMRERHSPKFDDIITVPNLKEAGYTAKNLLLAGYEEKDLIEVYTKEEIDLAQLSIK